MNLSDWRRRIDDIDKKLVELLNERSRCALEIGKLKQEANIPLYQPRSWSNAGIDWPPRLARVAVRALGHQHRLRVRRHVRTL